MVENTESMWMTNTLRIVRIGFEKTKYCLGDSLEYFKRVLKIIFLALGASLKCTESVGFNRHG